MAFIMQHLTFIYTSFRKIFCQNKIKKNCKFIFQVFFKNTDIRCEIKTRDTEVICRMSQICATSAVVGIGCRNMNLLLWQHLL